MARGVVDIYGIASKWKLVTSVQNRETMRTCDMKYEGEK